MKLLCSFCLLFGGAVFAQEQKHLTVAPLNGAARDVTLNADSIRRAGGYPSVVHLSGKVRIESPVCVPAGADRKMTCEGYLVLTADEATFDERSGEIEAHGAVKLTPVAGK